MLWDSWVAMGLITAAAWALACVIDACFVGEGIYRRPIDGVMVAGLFCGIPLLSFDSAVGAAAVEPRVAAVALLAGILYLLHIYYYFNALFALNDAANAEIFNTLSVLLVPVLAFVLLGEVLAPLQYVAIGLAIAGIAFLVRMQAARLSPAVIAHLALSVLCISLVMVLQAWVLQYADYGSAVWLFSAAAFGAVVLVAARSDARERLRYVFVRFGFVLVLVQLLELGAVLSSQRATDVGPSVSLVALLESSLPLFVMLFSWLCLRVLRVWPRNAPSGVMQALTMQTTAFPGKMISLMLIVAGMSLVRM